MDVIYMENTECFEIINRLSVRIAKDEAEQLKGSGILFLRQAGEMAFVFTAAHVMTNIFKEDESQVCLHFSYGIYIISAAPETSVPISIF